MRGYLLSVLLLAWSFPAAQALAHDPDHEYSGLIASINGVLSVDTEDDTNGVYGFDINLGYQLGAGFAIQGGLGVQNQDTGETDIGRLVFDVGLNYYFFGGGGGFQPYVGLTQYVYDDLDDDDYYYSCDCRHIDQQYSGRNTYLSIGALFSNYLHVRFETRLTDNLSRYRERYYDYRGRVSGTYEIDGIQDPTAMLIIGFGIMH